MDLDVHSPNENIRKIEDIIDIQKANGNFNVRQVAFKLPLEPESKVSANVAKSLESGLTKSISDSGSKKKFKKLRSKRHKSPLPDVISWPSDSDITVLRMKLCLSSDLKEKVGNIIPGDGLHQPDSSSMTNLATLIRQSQTASKHSLNIEEYLVPLTSWEREQELDQEPEKEGPILEKTQPTDYITKYKHEFIAYEPRCSRENNEMLSSKDSQSGYSKLTKKSKMARFLRLYFCPCCTCLYRLEKMRDEPSIYFSKRPEMY
ncbi:hypothetical protein PYW08_000708 [Mythimna loreyi]|uniref:Uncharacterized protein n=1 Tax=Mythimna loreyi TaxID=667449 RepID=A0ACC2R0Z4_9NEOP|nr:hypothetical protein PYW08_000708 [Mythimna loreyi]